MKRSTRREFLKLAGVAVAAAASPLVGAADHPFALTPYKRHYLSQGGNGNGSPPEPTEGQCGENPSPKPKPKPEPIEGKCALPPEGGCGSKH